MKFKHTHNEPIFSFWGYLFLLISTILICVFAKPLPMTIALIGLLCFTYTSESAALSRMIKLPVIIFICLIIISALFTSSLWNPVESSLSARLYLAMILVIKTFLLLLSTQIFATRISVAQITGLSEKIGLRGFGFVVGVALHMLPTLHQHAVASRDAMRLRGAFTRNRLLAEYRWCITLLSWMLRQGDSICIAARTKAFGLFPLQSVKRVFQWNDLIPLFFLPIIFF
ncbi:energy-coupling factor transporter transmembrane protein EcfT [bacterium]|nr:energy-coupling factor transporter transmembrane protein EcfT [bacterium]